MIISLGFAFAMSMFVVSVVTFCVSMIVLSMLIMAVSMEFADEFFTVDGDVKMSVQLLFGLNCFRKLAACDHKS